MQAKNDNKDDLIDINKKDLKKSIIMDDMQI
jgi:hypothetical protein